MVIFLTLLFNYINFHACSKMFSKSYQIKMLLYAFSFEHEPHIIVVILLSPFGAMFKRTECSFSGHSFPGKTPRAGLLIKAEKSQT